MTEAKKINPYLRTKVMTAGQEELRLMLYDGAIKFANQAKAAVEQQRIEDGYNNLTRAKKIVLELSNSLNPNLDQQLHERLTALYTYIYRLMVDANINRDASKIDESLDLLRYERETWLMVMQQAGKAPSTDDSTRMNNQNPIPIQTSQASSSYARSA